MFLPFHLDSYCMHSFRIQYEQSFAKLVPQQIFIYECPSYNALGTKMVLNNAHYRRCLLVLFSKTVVAHCSVASIGTNWHFPFVLNFRIQLIKKSSYHISTLFHLYTNQLFSKCFEIDDICLPFQECPIFEPWKKCLSSVLR